MRSTMRATGWWITAGHATQTATHVVQPLSTSLLHAMQISSGPFSD